MTSLWEFNGGVRLDGHKTITSEKPIVPANIPPLLILPLLQHIGEPAEPIVEVGEKVLKGQVIALCRRKNCRLLMSVPIHAPSSGTVVATELRAIPHPSGLMAPCIMIETDGQDTWATRTPLTNYAALPPGIVRDHIARAGIVGLGGAGFPTHIKLNSKNIDTLVINGAECTSYLTCDDRLMREYPHEIVAGTQIIRHVLGSAKRCIIAVEDNKPAAYESLIEAAAGESVEIVQVPTIYPTGEERRLVQVLTGKEVGRTVLPTNFGTVVHNVETARAVYQAVQHGQPLLSRIVTVTGNGVENPQNLEVLFGTPMHIIIDQCKRKSKIEKFIMGGPMTGFTLPNDEMPVIKTTNCLIVFSNDEVETPVMPCIRCGACANVCPVNLLPQQLYWHIKANDLKKTQEYHLFECIKCGCCACVCPSNIPLVSYFRYAKTEIRAIERKRKKAEIAKQRHEFRTFRLERNKKEQANQSQQKMAQDKSKEALIQAAIERVKTKKENFKEEQPQRIAPTFNQFM